MNPTRILVAGIGNIFFGDDAFGSEAARRMSLRPQPDGVRVVDFGIRALDLAYSLQDHEVVILLDAAPRGGQPGTVYVMEIPRADPSLPAGRPPHLLVDGHGLDSAQILKLAENLGGHPGRIFLIGCEPNALPDPDEMQMAMSDEVAAAVDEAVDVAESLVARLLRNGLEFCINKETSDELPHSNARRWPAK
jgi:hydrogenase maturation protease